MSKNETLKELCKPVAEWLQQNCEDGTVVVIEKYEFELVEEEP